MAAARAPIQAASINPPRSWTAAVGIEIRQTVSGLEIVQIHYLTVHDGHVYALVFSTTEDHENETRAKYDLLLDSWTWTSRG